MVNDVDQLGDGLLQGLTQLLTGVVTIIGTLAFYVLAFVPMGLVVALATPLSIVAATLVARFATSLCASRHFRRVERLCREMVTNQELIAAFAHKCCREDFQDINERLYTVGQRAQFASSLSNPSYPSGQ